MNQSIFKQFCIASFVIFICASCTSIEKLQKGNVAMINNVSYHDASFNNANASNGFLVKHKSNTYAITAKHVLMIAKSDKMTHVNFNGALKQWKCILKTIALAMSSWINY